MVQPKHDKYFDLAKRLSLKSDHCRYCIGCVIVKKSKVVGVGYNQLKTHPKSPHDYNTIHAEFSAILGVPVADLKGATVYVYRENKKGELALAKPCKHCQKMLEGCGVKTVYYTVDKGIDYYEIY